MFHTDQLPLGPGAATTRRRFLFAAGVAGLTTWLPTLAAGDANALGITEIAAGVYVHTGHHAILSPGNAGDIANACFIVGKQSIAVIDTGSTAIFGSGLRAAIAAVSPLPVRYVINTHMHPDHVFGNIAFQAAAPEFIAHHKMARGLAARADTFMRRSRDLLGEQAFDGTQIVYPTKPVADRAVIDLGERVLTLVARPTAHTDNDLTVVDELTGTLFLGDLLFADHIPTLDGSILGWLRLIAALKAETAARVVPGHGPASMSWPAAIEPVERYLSNVVADVRAAIKDGKTLSEATDTAGRSEQAAWRLFDEHHVRNVTAAYAELEWE